MKGNNPKPNKSLEQIKNLEPALAAALQGKTHQEQLLIMSNLSTQQTHSGPLPDSQTMETYANVIPDGGNRVMLMAEKQQEHRSIYEQYELRRGLNQSMCGMWMAFGLVVMLGAMAYCLAQDGHEAVAITVFSTVIVAVATVFITGRAFNKKQE